MSWISTAINPDLVPSIEPLALEPAALTVLYVEPLAGCEHQTLRALLAACVSVATEPLAFQLILLTNGTENTTLTSLVTDWMAHAAPSAQTLDIALLAPDEITHFFSLLAAVDGLICLEPLDETPGVFNLALYALAFGKQLVALPTVKYPDLFSTSVYWQLDSLSEASLSALLQQLTGQQRKTEIQFHYRQAFGREVEHCWQAVLQHWQAGDYKQAAGLCESLSLKKDFSWEELKLVEQIFKADGNDSAVQNIHDTLARLRAQAQEKLFVCGYGAPGPISRERCDQVYTEAFQRACEYIALHEINGNFVEFGTYFGYTAKIMADFISKFNIKCHLYLFDSFAGFPEIEPEDLVSYEVAVRKVWAKGALGNNASLQWWALEDALSHLLAPEQVHVIKGFFADTLPQRLPNEPIALLHLDCDLYSSTLEVLDSVLSRGLLQDGTIMMCDDYGCNRAHPNMGQRRAVREAFVAQSRYGYSPFFTYGWGSEAFFIHDYQSQAHIQNHFLA